MLPTCEVYGNTDLYGLGVRIGYYLQWLSLLFGAWVCPREVPKLRIANTFYISAIFFALVLLIRYDTLDDVDIYVTLLFTFGPAVYTCIFLTWHIAISYNLRWDLNRHSRVKPAGLLFFLLQGSLLIAQFGFQIWFWAVRLHRSSHDGCIQHAFHFGQVRLHDTQFRYFNVGISSLALILTIFYMLFKLKPGVFASSLTSNSQTTIIPSKSTPFLVLDIVSNLSVAVTTIITTELCIRWNKINGVTSINSAGQTVPLLLGIGCSIRVTYVGARSLLKDQTTTPTVNSHELATALLDDVETSLTDENMYPLQDTSNCGPTSTPIDPDNILNHLESFQIESTDQELTTSVVIPIEDSRRNCQNRLKDIPPAVYRRRITPRSPTSMFPRTYNIVQFEDYVDSIQNLPNTDIVQPPIINDTNNVAVYNSLPLSKAPPKPVTVHEHISAYEPDAVAFTSAIEKPRSMISATDYVGLYAVRGRRNTPVIHIHNSGGQINDPNTSTSAGDRGFNF